MCLDRRRGLQCTGLDEGRAERRGQVDGCEGARDQLREPLPLGRRRRIEGWRGNAVSDGEPHAIGAERIGQVETAAHLAGRSFGSN